ncbi:START domain-containing protein [Pseudoalteromonas sp. T1lg48]|uniref:START domain-containing protein n=1 Tax=Pseudoalteromonas sp. T1lg48 TaxID=2077100 RepID=UPI00131A16A7|nr:START domain-containing protein [Pseudoalteromonas sp. T1lg48]
MKQRVIFSLIGAISLLSAQSYAFAEQANWRTWKHSQQYQVHYYKTAEGHYAIKAKLFIAKATKAQFISLLHDTEHAPDWLEGVKRVTLLDSPSANQTLVFTHLNSPWPVADRELYTESCYQALEGQSSRLLIQSLDPDQEVGKGRVRIKELEALWTLTPRTDGLVLEYEVVADPGGTIPTWLSNRVSLNSVYKTLMNLRRVLPKTQVMSPLPLQEGDCSGFKQK